MRLDGADGRAVSFDLKDYAHVDHGYAATTWDVTGVPSWNEAPRRRVKRHVS